MARKEPAVQQIEVALRSGSDNRIGLLPVLAPHAIAQLAQLFFTCNTVHDRYQRRNSIGAQTSPWSMHSRCSYNTMKIKTDSKWQFSR